jgi:hypothetical protein
MSSLDPDFAQQLAQQRLMARRAMAQGRRWYLRSIILSVVAIAAVFRGGQVNIAIGVVMAILAAISVSMGRNMRRGAKAAEAKITTMEQGS